ncbi:MAG: hypothetical protein QXS56_04305, partial [Fervidicoccaceae archaeon]
KQREEKNKLLVELRELKEEKEKINKRYEEIAGLLRKNNEVKLSAEKDGNRTSLGALKRKIDQLTWKQQTTPLSVEDEKKLLLEIERLTQLYEKLMKAKELDSVNMELKAELASLKIKMRDVKERMRGKIAQLDSVRKKLKELSERMDEISPKINELGKQITEKSSTLNSLKEKIDQKYEELKKLQERSAAIRESIYKKRESEILEKKRKEAEEKLKTKGRITFEDLIALYSGTEDSSEEMQKK